MSKVPSKNSSTEILIRKELHVMGFRYRINSNALPGKPDIVLSKYKAIIFVHGCFWHPHGCNLSSKPKSNPIFWENKLSKNLERDTLAEDNLIKMGWRVCTVRLCSIRGKGKWPFTKLINEISDWIKSNDTKANFQYINT